MRLRVSFEYGAGVCLWADDAEARERWCSAVDFVQVALPGELVKTGTELLGKFDAGFVVNDILVERRWSQDEENGFHELARSWTTQVREVLAGQGIEVAEYGSEAEPLDEGPEFDGCVVACFTDAAARVVADRKHYASFAWEEVATWQGDVFKFRATERSPYEFLALLETQPGFVCGWWQTREGGHEFMLEGDPVEHAVECVRKRNATGFANFLVWLGVQRVHLGPALLQHEWVPSKAHRLRDAKGSWWEWVSFLRNASRAVQGKSPSERYKRSETERLFRCWTHGGVRQGWPADFGEALTRSGLRQERFSCWAK